MGLAGYWYALIYVIVFLVGAVIGFFADKTGSKPKSALIVGATLGAGTIYLLDCLIRLFSTVSQEWEWLYWITMIGAALVLFGAALFVLVL